MSFKLGDFVTAGAGDSAGPGRVTAILRERVEVELTDRPGFRFWYSVADVRPGTARVRPKPLGMMARFARREKTEEMRAVCEHLQLANVCPECAKG